MNFYIAISSLNTTKKNKGFSKDNWLYQNSVLLEKYEVSVKKLVWIMIRLGVGFEYRSENGAQKFLWFNLVIALCVNNQILTILPQLGRQVENLVFN